MKEETIQNIQRILKKFAPIIAEILGIIAAIIIAILGFTNKIKTEDLLSWFCIIVALFLGSFLAQNAIINDLQEKNTEIQKGQSSLQEKHLGLQTEINSRLTDLKDLIQDLSHPNLDSCLTENNEKNERAIISSSSKELILLQETGNLIIERHRKELKQFLRNGGHLSVIVCSGETNTQALLAFRNEDLHHSKEITHRLDTFHDQVRTLVQSPFKRANGLSKRIDIRYCPYPIDITSVFSPDIDVQAAVVRFAGFKVPYQKKLSLTAEAEYMPTLYQYYAKQIQEYRLSSYKKILITGKPHEGKTTLIKKLIQKIDITSTTPIFYIYTEEIVTDGKRTGFNVISSVHPEERLLAERNDEKSGLPYDVNVGVLDSLAEELLAHQNKVLIIDEIGIMQMNSNAFADAIEAIIKNPYCVLIGTITEDSRGNSTLESAKNSLMCELIEYTQDQHDSMLKKLTKELTSALAMYDVKGEM